MFSQTTLRVSLSQHVGIQIQSRRELLARIAGRESGWGGGRGGEDRGENWRERIAGGESGKRFAEASSQPRLASEPRSNPASISLALESYAGFDLGKDLRKHQDSHDWRLSLDQIQRRSHWPWRATQTQPHSLRPQLFSPATRKCFGFFKCPIFPLGYFTNRAQTEERQTSNGIFTDESKSFCARLIRSC